MPLNHDGWSWTAIGHGPRLVFDQLHSLDRPASVSELARHPALSNDRKTIRRQLRKLESFDLAKRLASGQWIVLAEDLDHALEQAADLTKRKGQPLSQRLANQHEAERIAYAKSRDPIERERKQRQRLQRRKAKRPRRRSHSLPDPVEIRKRREERALVTRHRHRPRIIRSGGAARPQHVLKPPPADTLAVL